MIHTISRKTLALSTALTMSLAGAASAATEIEIDTNKLSNAVPECRSLAELVQDRDNRVPDDQGEAIVEAINANDGQVCVQAADRLAAVRIDAEGEETTRATDSETESAEARETVNLAEEATIEGEAVVSVPEPQVDVEVDAPEVTVRKGQPEVVVDERPATIQVEQAQPNVAVEIPEIIVRVDIPAPSIYVQTEDPDVRVSTADPMVEVQQGEPRVTVRQPDPELTVDLDVDPDAEGAEGTEQARSDALSDGEMNTGGDVETARSEPQVNIVEAEGQPKLAINSADPSVEFQASEPNVTVSFAQEPTIEVNQTGEANVTFETAEEREARRARQQEQQQAQNAADTPAAPGEAGEAEAAR